MKTKIIFAVLLFAAVVTLAQTNFDSDTNRITSTNQIVYKIAVVTNWYMASTNLLRFGNVIIDVKKPNKLEYIYGTVNAVRNKLVLIDIQKYHTTGSASGNQEVGAYSASGGSGYYEFDKTIAITNFPNIQQVAENQSLTLNALKVGIVSVEGHVLEFYDCGRPWIYQVISTNKIAIRQQ